MIEIKSKLRKWGNSFGIIVPQKALDKTKVKEGDEITVFLNEKSIDLSKFFGAHRFSKSSDKLLKEMDDKLYDD